MRPPVKWPVGPASMATAAAELTIFPTVMVDAVRWSARLHKADNTNKPSWPDGRGSTPNALLAYVLLSFAMLCYANATLCFGNVSGNWGGVPGGTEGAAVHGPVS